MANFENITIEKGMYQTKGGISGALEKLDPSENYRGTFPRICEQSRYAGHGESGYSPKSCGNRDRH